MNENEHIDKRVKRLLEGHEATPSLSSFDLILDRLEKKKRRRFFFILFSGIGLCGGIYLMSLISSSFYGSTNRAQTAGIIHIKKTVPLPASNIENLKASQDLTKAQSGSVENDPVAKNKAIPALSKQARIFSQSHTAPAMPMDNTTKIKQGVPGEEKQDLIVGTYDQPATNTSGPPDQGSKAEDVAALANITPLYSSHPDTTLRIAASSSIASMPQEKPKKISSIFLGLNITPQAGSFLIAQNPHSSPVYSPGQAQAYRNDKRSQSHFRFTYGFGFRLGMNLAHNWQVIAGLGYQQYNYRELPSTFAVYQGPGFVYNNAAPTSNNLDANTTANGYRNVMHYASFSLEAAKIIRLKSLIKLKAGMALQVNQLLGSHIPIYYQYPPSGKLLGSTVFVPHVKLGLLYDLSRKIQLQLLPDFYVSANSAFDKQYVIRQNPYGAGLEALLLFKIR